MVLEKIYVARHGYRANWLPPPHAPNPTGIDSDPPLAPYGVEQAKELANFIVNSPLVDPKPELIFSSPFYRCVETSTPLANAIDVPIFVERGIGEWYKKDRGVIPEPASLELLKTFFGRVSADWDPKTVVPSLEGEDESDIFARCQEFFPKFLSKFEAAYPQVKTVMFVTHAATKIALGMAILKYTGVRELLRKEHGGDGKTVVLRAGTCSLDSYSRNGDSWSLGFNGETSFLEKGEEMNWHFCELFLKLLRSLVEIYAFGVTTNLLPILADTYEAGSDEDIAERARLAAAAAAAKSESVDVDDKAGDFLESEEELESVYVTLALPRVAGKVEKTTFESSIANPQTGGSQSKGSSEKAGSVFLEGLESMLPSSVDPNSTLRISGLETENPLLKINHTAYQGEWTNLNGSELIFNENGEFVAKSAYRLNLTAGTLVPKGKDEDAEGPSTTKRYSLLQSALARIDAQNSGKKD